MCGAPVLAASAFCAPNLKHLTQTAFGILTVATDELTDALRALSDTKAAQKRLQAAEAEQKRIKDQWTALTTVRTGRWQGGRRDCASNSA